MKKVLFGILLVVLLLAITSISFASRSLIKGPGSLATQAPTTTGTHTITLSSGMPKVTGFVPLSTGTVTTGTKTTGTPTTVAPTSTPIPPEKLIKEIKFTLKAPELGKEYDRNAVSLTEGIIFDHVSWEAEGITPAGGFVGQNNEGDKANWETRYKATIFFKVADGYGVEGVKGYPTSLKIGNVNGEKDLEVGFFSIGLHNIKTQYFTIKKEEAKEEVKEESTAKSGEAVKENSGEKVVEDNKQEEKIETYNWSKASKWAIDELNKANESGLIPKVFDKEDLTTNITRKEFAHVAVKLWEKVSGKKATTASKNPFKDTKDVEVLKAYNLEITKGTSDTTFEPDTLITREQMATMMTRALQKAGVDTMVNLNKVEKFADDSEMSSWAKDSVYFMSDIDIIKGIGNNKFGVKGNATREQSLLISVRSADKFNKAK